MISHKNRSLIAICWGDLKKERPLFRRFRYGELALALLIVSLVASGCHSIRNDSSPKFPQAAAVHVLSTNSVPFDLEDNHIHVRGTLNGRDVRFLFDTGATTVLASPETAAAAGLAGGTRIAVSGFGDPGRGTARLCTAESMGDRRRD